MDPLILIEGHSPKLLSRVIRDAETRRRYLAQHWGRDDAVHCLCQGRPGIAMGVAHRRRPRETYYIYPLHQSDPVRHKRTCPHYHEADESPTRETEAAPVLESDGRLINVNLDGATYKGATSQGASEAAANRGADVQSRGKLQTLLEALWVVAELNTWHPGFAGKRHYGVVQHRLTDAAHNFSIKHWPLGPRFLMPPAYSHGRREICNQALMHFYKSIGERRQEKKPYGYVVGVLKGYETPGQRGRIALSHLAPKLYHSSRAITHAARRWAFEPGQTVVIACVESVRGQAKHRDGKPRTYLNVLDLAALNVADRQTWIPVDSGYERQLCQALVEQQRTFEKPMAASRLLGEGSEDLLPDFVLKDASPSPLYMEVLGMMNDPDYADHVEDKRERYHSRKMATWWWDTREPMPALPERK